ncbi:class II aldolase/adducin family protein [Anianabacter salinae]|uniref:class II aldolase/adducin family protein n=1 Tax=Anianabacter salinae TaxID=2851023 RepID=UPI00225E110E|nr:class II aldolase/adducin family protein [Anianabacter salinae]
MDDLDTRQAIIDACLAMNRSGLNQGTSGNVSVRSGKGALITPTALPYARMTPEDIVWVGFDGAVQGTRRPSSEWCFHLDLLRARDDLNAVVHAHPSYCTTLAIHARPIPPVHYMIAAAGGHDIRVAKYATYGTPELSAHVLAAMDGRRACLMAHHGMLAAHGTLDKAMWLATEVETLARQYAQALMLGEPPELSLDEIDRVLEKFAGYGIADD